MGEPAHETGGGERALVETHRFATTVPLAFDVHFTREIFTPGHRLLAQVLQSGPEPSPARWLCCVDDGLAAARPTLIGQIQAWAAAQVGLELAAPPLLLPGGEAVKNSFDAPLRLLELAQQVQLSRQSHVVAIGGGAFLDAVGFGASLFHRGARLVRVPSTVLAQNDSGVGVKNGLNFAGVKNAIGTFAPPAAVLIDYSLLDSLPDRDWIAGIAEAFKVAIIKDAAYLEWLLAHTASLRQRCQADMERLIRRCAELHLEHIVGSGDPFEQGSARPLDFGHWAAHKLESLSGHELRHGEAVAIGIALDLLIAAELGLIPECDAHCVITGLLAVGLPVWHVALDHLTADGTLSILAGIEEFRAHLGGRLAITLPNPLGQRVEIHELGQPQVVRALCKLRPPYPHA